MSSGADVIEVIQETSVVEVIEQPAQTVELMGGVPGPPGPQGPIGPEGPTGPSGADSYVHTEVAPSASWHIVHGQSRYPSVTIVDSGGTEIEADISYVDANTVDVTFASPTSGKAYLN